MQFLIMAALLLAPVFGETWKGALVDAKCYDAEERNANPTTTLQAVNRDRDAEIDYCHPRAKTKTFTLVDHDGISYKLDSAGDAKAADFVRSKTTKSRYEVVVTGAKSDGRLKVESIAPAR